MAELIDQVCEVVRLIPPGRVVSYGDIAELLGTGPRAVGQAMASAREPNLPWWRVVNASGRLPRHLLQEAQRRWQQEGTLLVPGQDAVQIRYARADLSRLADAAEQVLGVLPGLV